MKNRRHFLALAAGGAAFGLIPAARAGEPAAQDGDPNVGPVTHLPIPRFVSLKTDQGYARRGPSLTQRIDWVFTREGMPLKLTGEFDHWRRVEDKDGLGGWIHYTLISGIRTVIVTQPMAELRTLPKTDAAISAKAEQGVIARLRAARSGWCRITAGGEGGWVQDDAVWGILPGETLG